MDDHMHKHLLCWALRPPKCRRLRKCLTAISSGKVPAQLIEHAERKSVSMVSSLASGCLLLLQRRSAARSPRAAAVLEFT